MSAPIMLKTYYHLTKPGIVYGNALTTIAAFLFASQWHVDVGTFVGALLGISLVIASACVFNNYIDRNIDKVMARTKKRALVSGAVSGQAALIYATVLGLIGAGVLYWYTNLLTLGVALFGFFAYVVVYGIGKRKTVHGTVIGSISGAVPPVVGYCAATNRFDAAAVLLFLILVCWQMPHFYAIAMYRRNDYAAAHIPVLSVVKGMHATKLYILVYILLFMVACGLLTVFGYTGYVYLIAMSLLSLYWLKKGAAGITAHHDIQWARNMFGLSLAILLAWSVLISLDRFLP